MESSSPLLDQETTIALLDNAVSFLRAQFIIRYNFNHIGKWSADTCIAIETIPGLKEPFHNSYQALPKQVRVAVCTQHEIKISREGIDHTRTLSLHLSNVPVEATLESLAGDDVMDEDEEVANRETPAVENEGTHTVTPASKKRGHANADTISTSHVFEVASRVSEDILESLNTRVGLGRSSVCKQVFAKASTWVKSKISEEEDMVDSESLNRDIVVSLRSFFRESFRANSGRFTDKVKNTLIKIAAACIPIDCLKSYQNIAFFKELFQFGKIKFDLAVELRSTLDIAIAIAVQKDVESNSCSVIGHPSDNEHQLEENPDEYDSDSEDTRNDVEPPIDVDEHSPSSTKALQDAFTDFCDDVLRKIRVDRISEKHVRAFCHDCTPFAATDTAVLANHLQVRNEDGSFESHPLMQKFETNDRGFELFKQSQYYADFLQDTYWGYDSQNGEFRKKLRHMGLSIFSSLICPCIGWGKQKCCANMKTMAVHLIRESYGRALTFDKVVHQMQECGCSYCKSNWHRSTGLLHSCIMCPAKEIPELSYVARVQGTYDDAVEDNLNTARQRDSLNPPSTHRSRTNYKQDSVARKEKKIHSEDFLGKFELHDRKCADQLCTVCGVARFFAKACPSVFGQPDILFPVKCFRPQPRGNGFQMEITEVKMTGAEFKDAIVKTLQEYFPHNYIMTVSNHFQRNFFATMEEGCVIVNEDFGALVSAKTEQTENCAQPWRAIQEVLILGRAHNETNKRVHRNIDAHVWADNAHTVKSGYFFAHNAFTRVLQEISHDGSGIHTILKATDGCSAQYKSRNSVASALILADNHKVDAFIHVLTAAGITQ